jgi:hypothetical protein
VGYDRDRPTRRSSVDAPTGVDLWVDAGRLLEE